MPDEVNGDLQKFRQIISALIDFSLKSTGEVKVKLKSDFILKTGGFDITFSIKFTPQFQICKFLFLEFLANRELELLFGIKDDLFSNHEKLTKSFGLPLHVLPGIVKFLGGAFRTIEIDDQGEVHLEFNLQFGSIRSKTLNNTIQSPMIRGNSKRTVTDGQYILLSPLSKFSKNRRTVSKKIMKNENSEHTEQEEEKDSRITLIRDTIRTVESLSSEQISKAM